MARDPSLRARFDEVEAGCSWTRNAIDAAGALEWLAALPAEQRMTLPDGTRLVGVHASPGRDDGPGISPDVPAADLAAMLAGADADVICAGHTHRATDRTVTGGRAVNLGSVSNAVVVDRRASYVTIDARRDGFDLAHHWVDYDHGEAIARIRRSVHPRPTTSRASSGSVARAARVSRGAQRPSRKAALSWNSPGARSGSVPHLPVAA